MKIQSVDLKIISDSRNQDTLAVTLTSSNLSASASVPAGKSRSSHEAYVKEPHLAKIDFDKEVKPDLLKINFTDQAAFDNWLIKLDGTIDKRRLGGNLILVLSLAFARLMAQANNLALFEYINHLYRGSLNLLPPALPVLIINMINGGRHADNNLDFQEFQIIPHTSNLKVAFDLGHKFYKTLYTRLLTQFSQSDITLGDEGGFSAPIASNEQAINLLKAVARDFTFNQKASFGLSLDAAASSFYYKSKDAYLINNEEFSPSALTDYYEHLIHKYGLIALEDPYHEDAFPDFANLNQRKGIYIIADDLTSTNPHRLTLAINNDAADAIIIKPNQIGSLTETIAVSKKAHQSGWQLIVSHRSGETEDDFIADLAVGLSAWGIKAGAPATSVRLTKYHRLLAIAKSLHSS